MPLPVMMIVFVYILYITQLNYSIFIKQKIERLEEHH